MKHQDVPTLLSTLNNTKIIQISGQVNCTLLVSFSDTGNMGTAIPRIHHKGDHFHKVRNLVN